MSLALRLQIGALVVLLYIIINYFSAKRRRITSHRMYSELILCAFLNVVLDATYVFLTGANGEPNDLVFKLYFISLGLFVVAIDSYQIAVIKELNGNVIISGLIDKIPMIVVMIFTLILPVDYHKETEFWFSIKGPGVITMWVAIFAYLLYMLITFSMNFGIFSGKMKVAFSTVYIACTLVFVFQWIDIYNIITSIAVAFSVLSMFAIIENPDQLLIEQLKFEKDRANAANESKSSFIAHISHEIRTPINAILGMNEMIIRDSKEPNSVQYAQDIASAANTLYSIINDVLDLSKLESGKMEIAPANYSLNQLLYDTISRNQSRIDAKKLDFYVDINTALPSVYYGDDVRIKQVLSNILSNAIKYTHEGFVRLSVDGEFHGNLIDLTFSIKDTGIGIREEDFSKLFVAFERIEESRNRNIEGTGLGMNITNNLLRMMGSRLEISSVYGEGSIFSFTVTQRIVDTNPVGDYETFKKSQKDHVSFDFTAPTVKLLIVDDNTLNRRVFLSLLEHTKMQIDEARGGREAIEMVKNEKYDLIFLDNLMPELSGLETIEIIKSDMTHMNVNTPIVMLSANAMTTLPDEYKFAGFCAYLTKPIQDTELEKVFRKYLPSFKVTYADSKKKKKREFGNENWKKELPSIRGIDWSEAIKHLNTEEVLYASVREFQKSIKGEADELDKYAADLENEENLKLFKIKVHALKSASMMIGAEMLSEGAKELEEAAAEGNIKLIKDKYPYMINYFRAFESKLEMFSDDEEPVSDIDFPQVIALAEMVKLEMNDLNRVNAEDAIGEIRSYSYPEDIEEIIEKLEDAVEKLDAENANEAADELIGKFRELRG
ncbi:MAG: ATP-binding protein [Lachnospiraceae bacterium]|nr:ATP-binding protein [Lachnospiraceae bacterium]